MVAGKPRINWQEHTHGEKHSRVARHYSDAAKRGGAKAPDYHRAASRSHEIASEAFGLAGSRKKSAHESVLGRVASRAAAGSSAHHDSTASKSPTLRGPKGGTYRVVNGRKVYLGKDGK